MVILLHFRHRSRNHRKAGCQILPQLDRIDRPSKFIDLERDEAERLKVLPMFKVRGRLIVAMAEPQNLPAIDRLAASTGCQIQPVLALEGNILEFSRKYQT